MNLCVSASALVRKIHLVLAEAFFFPSLRIFLFSSRRFHYGLICLSVVQLLCLSGLSGGTGGTVLVLID